MTVVIDDKDAALLAQHLKAPFDPGKAFQGLADLRHGHPQLQAHRKSVPIVAREIGKVVASGRHSKLVHWESGRKEKVRFSKAPGELVSFGNGEWLRHGLRAGNTSNRFMARSPIDRWSAD